MAYSRCGLTNAQYRGTKISFVRHVNDLLTQYSIPLPLFAAVRTLADGVNAEFTVILRSFVCISSSFRHWLLRKGLDDDRDGLLLIDDGLYIIYIHIHI